MVAFSKSKSSGDTITGPIGAKLSSDLPRIHCVPLNCKVRADTSLPMVYPKICSLACSRDIFLPALPMTITSSPS